MFGKKKVVVEEVGMDEFFENATPKEEKKEEEKSEKKNRLLGKVAGIGLLTLGIGGALIKTFGQKDDNSDEDEDDSDDSTDDDDEDSEDSEDNDD